MVKVEKLGKQPENSIKERLVPVVLCKDGKKVILQDLGCPQLLPHISRLVLMPQVADQILHTLFRDRTHAYADPWKKLYPAQVLFIHKASEIQQSSPTQASFLPVSSNRHSPMQSGSLW